MSDLADTLRQLGKEYGQAGGYIHLELAGQADVLERERDDYRAAAQRATALRGQLELELLALQRDVENLIRDRNAYLRKLDEVDRFVGELETHAEAFIPGSPGEDAYNTAAMLLRKIIGRKMGYDD